MRTRVGRLLVLVAGLVALVGACGGSDVTGSLGRETTPEALPTPTSSAPVSWTSPDEIATNAPEQVLPPLEQLIAAIDAENTALGATDGIRYDLEDQVFEVSIREGDCTQIAFASFFYDASVALTETPDVGLLAPGIIAMVCTDATAAADQSASMFAIADLEQGPCPVDEVGPDGLGVRICPLQPGDELRAWKAAAAGTVDRVLIRVTADLGPGTDPGAGARSMAALVDVVLAHVDARLV